MKRPALFVLYLALVIALLVTGIRLLPPPGRKTTLPPAPALSPLPSGASASVRVIRVVDGDTIEVEGKKTVRYIGINAPETKHPVKKVECYGKEASKENGRLVAGKYVRLEKDVSETDKYGRLLRYVWAYDTPEATGGGVFVNDALVREGYAQVSTYPPDVKYTPLFIEAQREARTENRGLWASCVGKKPSPTP